MYVMDAMGVLNKKLCSWATTCRKMAGCGASETSPEPPQPREVNLREVVAPLPRRTPKFPSRERNYAVRRRHRHNNNNNGGGNSGGGASSIGASCELCSRSRQHARTTAPTS